MRRLFRYLVDDQKPKRLSPKEIRNTLPKGWEAFETLEGRVISWNIGEYTSWTHLDPSIPRDQYDRVDLVEHEHEQQFRSRYEALSYTWGSAEHLGIALVEGAEELLSSDDDNPEEEEAIRHLRYEDESRVMWIDALCINQDDSVERGQ
ncbi:hypothetical protein M426DRAFT_321590 [Hypoxylon sp. CI-4A]|nr:hypothetical protein M426DRAFT_321590 [Hypoxylon sp. CI-4A]